MHSLNIARRFVGCSIAGAVLAGALLSACGKPQAAVEGTQTAFMPQGSATPANSELVTGTADAMATATARPEPTTPAASWATPVAPVIITPSDGASRGCAPGQAAFLGVTSQLSLCAPPDVSALSDVNANGEPGISISASGSASSLQFAVGTRISKTPAILEPLNETCAKAFEGGAVATLQVGSLTAAGCQAQTEVNSADGPLMELHLSASLPPAVDGSTRYLNVSVTWRTESAGADTLARAVVASIRVVGS